MGGKAMMLGFIGQRMDDKLKRKIEAGIAAAVEKYGVSDFYFANEDDGEANENKVLEELWQDRYPINTFAAEAVKAYQEKNKDKAVRSAMVVARTQDTNFNIDLYDEVIQSYSICYKEAEDDQTGDAFILRDEFLGKNLNFIFWYSNAILVDSSYIAILAQSRDTKIIIL